MGTLRSINVNLPGSHGLNTQEATVPEDAQTQSRFGAVVTNGVVDKSGKLTSRQDFVNQTSGLTGTIQGLFTLRKTDATEVVLSCGSGIIYSGITTLTSRYDYRQATQAVDVGGAKTGASATGLANDATTYGLLISIDGGGNQQVTVTGSAAQTYTNLITEINTDITGGSCSLVAGNLRFTSATVGSGSVSITNSAGTASNVLLTTLTNYVALRTAYAGTVSNNNWQFATLGSKTYAAQAGQRFTVIDETAYAETAIVGQPWTASPNCVIAAYGRVWAADDNAGGNRYTIWWSNLLDGTAWNTGDSGSLSLVNAWPQGQDSIVALVPAYGRLIVLGRNSILMYTLPADNDPASMSLTDTVSNLGCVARDSVVVTDNGVYFLSDNGIYRIDRLGQVTSLLTLPQVSKLYTSDILADIAAETGTKIRAGYYPKEGWYVLSFPTQNRTYCLHTRKLLPELDVPVATVWTNTNMPFRGFAFDKDGNWYCGGTNGVHKYTGYSPDAASNAYTFTLTLQWNNFGDESKLKHFKGVALVLETASGQTGTFSWKEDYIAGTSRSASFTCDSTEFAENPGVGLVRISGVGGSFNAVQPSVAFSITGAAVTIHQLRLFAAPGKTKL